MDHLEEILKGNFRYEAGALSFAEDRLDLTAYPGDRLSGVFHIVAENERGAEGTISSSDPRFICRQTQFKGGSAEIPFTFDAGGLEPGDVIRGDIDVISTEGEYRLEFAVDIRQKYAESSVGQIRNLFHFTNLARQNFKEAVKIFYSPEFITALEGPDSRFLNRYRMFSSARGNVENVEEFLISIRKKSPVRFSVNTEELAFSHVEQEEGGEILITKTGWGYCSLKVSQDADFLRLDRSWLSEEDFTGGVCLLRFSILPEKLHGGKNPGRIIITGAHTDLSVLITAERDPSPAREEEKKLLLRQRLVYGLMQDYVRFRIHSISAKEWCSRSMKAVEQMLHLDDRDLEARLYMVQILLSEGRTREARFVLQHLKKALSEDKNGKAEYLACYDYLEALSLRDEEVTKKNAAHVRELFRVQPDSMRLLWLLIYMDESLGSSPDEKLFLLSARFRSGCRSPLLFIEALQAMTEDPDALKAMDEFAVQSLWWGVKNGIVHGVLTSRIILLSNRVRGYSPLLLRVLEAYYDRYHSLELLSAVCTHLIRNRKSHPSCFRWFALGVRNELKITRLYESYLESVPLGYPDLLPRQVLLYFGMETDTPEDRMAFLYANMIRHRNEAGDLLRSYGDRILSFAVSAARRQRTGPFYAEVYDYAVTLGTDAEREPFLKAVCPLVFKHEINVPDPRIRRVCTLENGFKSERSAPVTDGTAYLSLYGGEYELVFEDVNGRRTMEVQGVQDRTMLRPARFVHAIRSGLASDIGLSLYICGSGRRAIQVSRVNAICVRLIVDSPEIDDSLREEYRAHLMQYYYDQEMMAELDQILSTIPLEKLSRYNRSWAVRFMVIRGMRKKAYDCICEYGPEGVDPKVLVRLMSRMIREEVHTDDERLLMLSNAVFRRGKYDETLLQFLCDNYQGSLREMRDIWTAACGFGTDSHLLEERILTQMLFSRSFVGEKDRIFRHYVEDDGREKVIGAYLDFSAYEYLVKDRVTDPCIFEEILRVFRQEGTLRDAPALALTHWLAARDTDGKTMEEVSVLIRTLMEKGIIFSYFLAYEDYIPALLLLKDRFFIEYTADPRKQAELNFMLCDGENDPEEFSRESIPDLFKGMRTKAFTLFSEERLQYYITESEGDRRSAVSSGMAEQESGSFVPRGSRYDLLNDILISHSGGDEEKMTDLMEQYIRKTEAASELFHLK